MTAKLVVFTDLDATLLDRETYNPHGALPVLRKLKKSGIPVILTTSKTRSETENVARKLRLRHPIIVENGGAVFIPDSYFPQHLYKEAGIKPLKRDGYRVVGFGVPYRMLRMALRALEKKAGVNLIGFGDLSEEQISAVTGLRINQARLAARREFDEPFLIAVDDLARILTDKNEVRQAEKDQKSRLKIAVSKRIRDSLINEGCLGRVENSGKIIQKLRLEARKKGLQITAGGRFYHLTGKNDKGKAVELLISLYRLKFGNIITVGLGDSDTDLPMLKVVDYPVLVARPDGSHSKLSCVIKNTYRTRRPGPQGWAEALEHFLSRYE